jgi:hypothetical protein
MIKMKKYIILFCISILTTSLSLVKAQSGSVSQSLGLYVFPANGQDAATQEADEMACFTWAKNQTGYDPINPTQVVGAQVDRSADGTALVGAGVGAAGGAAIGAIAGDAGKGAAIGAVVGGIRGRRAKVVGDERQQQANNQGAAAKEKELANDYNKAFSACMEGKGYTVK